MGWPRLAEEWSAARSMEIRAMLVNLSGLQVLVILRREPVLAVLRRTKSRLLPITVQIIQPLYGRWKGSSFPVPTDRQVSRMHGITLDLSKVHILRLLTKSVSTVTSRHGPKKRAREGSCILFYGFFLNIPPTRAPQFPNEEEASLQDFSLGSQNRIPRYDGGSGGKHLPPPPPPPMAWNCISCDIWLESKVFRLV